MPQLHDAAQSPSIQKQNGMMTNDFPHTYGRTELALAYNPTLHPKAAWLRLKEWIHYNKDLTSALAKTDYNPKRRTFTPKQVKLIFQYLGEP